MKAAIKASIIGVLAQIAYEISSFLEMYDGSGKKQLHSQTNYSFFLPLDHVDNLLSLVYPYISFYPHYVCQRDTFSFNSMECYQKIIVLDHYQVQLSFQILQNRE